MGNFIFSLIWLIILVVISFWVAFFCAGWYVLILPITVCIDGCKTITDFLLKGVQFPRYCAQAMMEGRGF